jgi:MFS transporter, DHA2 family, methylenomycin A resistance protein
MTTTTTGAKTAERPGRVLTVMCAGMFLVLLDVTIVNVALPDVARGLGVGVPSLQWVVDGYAVTIASLLLAGGTIGDRIGHRRVLLVGFALFGAASVVCATAPTSSVLIAGRIAQGAGGALLLPSTMAVIADVYPDRAAQARALGTWAAVSSLALPAGPLLGGFLVGVGDWRLVFWINVPLVAVTMVAALRVVPQSPGRVGGRFDLRGLVGFVIGLAGLVFTIISAGRHASALVIGVAAAVTLAALGGAIAAERDAESPILPLDLLRRRDFLSPNVVALTMNLVFNGLLFVTMLYLQDLRHRSPIAAGVLVLPLAVPLVALAPVSGRLTARHGPRRAIAIGCLTAALGTLPLLGVTANGGLAWLVTSFTVLGCGAGLVTASVVAATVRATPPDRSGLATGVSNTARQTGTATGVAIFGAVVGSQATAAHFVAALHALAVAAAVLWLAAFVVAMTGIERNGSAATVGAADYARRRA